MQDAIKNFDAFGEGRVDFTAFNDALPGKLGLTDIDGLMERHGYFLILEKKKPGHIISWGQEITFKALIKLEKFTVVVFWGSERAPQKIRLSTLSGTRFIVPDSSHTLVEIIKRWFAWANTRPNKGFEFDEEV